MRFLFAFFSLLVCLNVHASNPQVEIKTSQGAILVELYPDKAPQTVGNFLHYVKSDFYRNTIFHRVVNRFVIQGGGYTSKLEAKKTSAPIPSEATNGLKNDAGTLAMARSFDPDSATSQFFINVERNRYLNHHKPQPEYYGYTVFGKVLKGMDIVQKIAAVPTTTAGPFFTDVPMQDIVIEDVTVVPEKITEPAPVKKNIAPAKSPKKTNKIKPVKKSG